MPCGQHPWLVALSGVKCVYADRPAHLRLLDSLLLPRLASHLTQLHIAQIHTPLSSSVLAGIFQLHHLKRLRLSASAHNTDGVLEALPPEVAQLQSLERLEVQLNRAQSSSLDTAVSSELSQLQQLTRFLQGLHAHGHAALQPPGAGAV